MTIAAFTLIDRGANTETETTSGSFNQRSWKGLNPIALAALKSRTEIVELLLNFGATFLARPRTKSSLLHLAIAEDEPTMLESLLTIDRLCNPDVLNYQDARGNTALHLCTGNHKRHTHIRALLKAGADPNISSLSGHSPLDIALQSHDWLTAAWIKNPGLVDFFRSPDLNVNGIDANWATETSGDWNGSTEDVRIINRAYSAVRTGARMNGDQFYEMDVTTECNALQESIRALEAAGARKMRFELEYKDEDVSLNEIW